MFHNASRSRVRFIKLVLPGVVLLALSVSVTAKEQPKRRIQYFVASFSSVFTGNTLNDFGQAAGSVPGDEAPFRMAAIWDHGVVQELGTLATNLRSSAAWGINERREVVGNSFVQPAFVTHGFLWADGVLHDLGASIPSFAGFSAAIGINNRGQIVGDDVYRFEDWFHAVRWDDGVMNVLDTFGGRLSSAFAINDSGVSTGFESNDMAPNFNQPGDQAVRWGRTGHIKALGITGEGAAGRAINRQGQIVGTGQWGGSAVAAPFLWTRGRIVRLAPSGVANGINDRGQVVGSSEGHGFLWQDGVRRDINDLTEDPSWQVTGAQDINNRGEILATACQFGTCGTVLLEPFRR